MPKKIIDSPAGFFGKETDDVGEKRTGRILENENYCIKCGSIVGPNEDHKCTDLELEVEKEIDRFCVIF